MASRWSASRRTLRSVLKVGAATYSLTTMFVSPVVYEFEANGKLSVVHVAIGLKKGRVEIVFSRVGKHVADVIAFFVRNGWTYVYFPMYIEGRFWFPGADAYEWKLFRMSELEGW